MDMAAFRLVEHLDVVEDIALGLFSVEIYLAAYAFLLDSRGCCIDCPDQNE